MPKIILTLFAAFLFSSDKIWALPAEDSVVGKYIWAPMHNYIDSSVLILRSNGRFIESTKRGYLSNKQWYMRKGKWEIKGDTILLSRLHFVSRAGDRRSIVPRRFYERFAITNDSCLLYDDKNNAPRLYCKSKN